MAVDAGVKLVIGTDAHSTAGLNLMDFGVATAARGWATKSDILNTLSVAQLKNWVHKKRSR
jgi:DNA polymerase (family 10)